MKGKHTKNEIHQACGLQTTSDSTKLILELEKLKILKKDGMKSTPFGFYEAYRVDEEILAEFIETNEELKPIINNLDQIRSVIWGDIFSGVKGIFKKNEKENDENLD